MHVRYLSLLASVSSAALLSSDERYAALGLPPIEDENYGMEAMSWLKREKLKTHEIMSAAGAYDLDRYSALSKATCTGGKAADYACKALDMVGFVRHQDFGSKTRKGNDVWGWTSKDGREFGIVCQTDGTGFVEVLKDGSMVPLGRLPTASSSALWRDAKVVGDHAYIVADVGGHGMQIFDMKLLLDIKHGSPKNFTQSDLSSHFTGWGKCHNAVHNEATNTVFCSGGDKCGGKLHAVDVADPKSPKDLGCVGTHSYSHDAHCLIYNGVDSKYNGREICFSFNEKQMVINDITDRKSPKELSVLKYKGAGYTHQGWVATKDMKYLLMGDEMDERLPMGDNKNGNTITYIVDISKLEAPAVTGTYFSPVKAIDHNLYVIDNLVYMSNYNTGLRIVDISTINSDPTGKGFKEIAFFDVYPEDDGKEQHGFVGAWSVYPFFKSGYILINSMERGIVAVKHQK